MIISIIVPVYKVENYINRCIDSILKQTYTNFELILVDDGSPDNCPEICDTYAKMDSRIEVIHKKNGGLSNARNIGLKKAQGDYVLFVDSDDFIEKDTCEIFINLTNQYDVDIVTGEVQQIYKGKKIIIKNGIANNRIYSGIEYFEMQLKNNLYATLVVRNLYKREFLKNNSLFFTPGIYHEDVEWIPKVFLKAQKVISSGYCFYHYAIREDSITTQKSKDKSSKDMITICTITLINLCDEISDNNFKVLFKGKYIVHNYLWTAFHNYKYFITNKNELDRNFPIKYAKGSKMKFLAGLFYINYSLFYYIWFIIHWIKSKCKN